MLEFFLELLFELIGQLVLELGFHCLLEPFNSERAVAPIVSFFGYALLGVFAGWISVLIIPAHFIRNADWQLINLLVSPLLLGWFFTWFGRVRERRGLETIALDRFSCGFIFALTLALYRYAFAT